MNVSIKGLDKVLVLQALWKNCKAQGVSPVHVPVRTEVSLEECKRGLTESCNFDYWKGKVLKVNLEGDEFDPSCYDRLNGEGAAQRAIDSIN